MRYCKDFFFHLLRSIQTFPSSLYCQIWMTSDGCIVFVRVPCACYDSRPFYDCFLVPMEYFGFVLSSSQPTRPPGTTIIHTHRLHDVPYILHIHTNPDCAFDSLVCMNKIVIMMTHLRKYVMAMVCKRNHKTNNRMLGVGDSIGWTRMWGSIVDLCMWLY